MATKKIYLVDTENVGSTWKDLLPIKMGADQILLFFTENSPNVSYSDLQLILQFPDRFEMIKCNPGKNGLDFQLVSYLGYLLKTASKSNYVIVSNDNGFDAVVKFWQERGMSVSRMNVHHVLRQEDTARLKETASPVKTRTEPSAEKHGRAAQTARKTTLKRSRKPSGQPTENMPENNSIEAFTDSQKEDMGNNDSITEIVTDHQNHEPEPADSTEYPAVLDNTGTVVDSPVIDTDNTNGSSTFKNDAESLKNSGLAQDSDILSTAEDNKLSADTVAPPIACTPETAAPTDIEISQEEEQAALVPAQGEETKRKSTRTARTAPRRKAAPDGAETQAQTKKRKRASGAPLAQPIEPAFPDTENMELDFSNLTVSEKAALLRKYLPKEFCENQESFEIVSDIMFGHDTTNHHQLHLAFVKSFGDEKGTLIYKAFRPHLAEFRA